MQETQVREFVLQEEIDLQEFHLHLQETGAGASLICSAGV